MSNHFTNRRGKLPKVDLFSRRQLKQQLRRGWGPIVEQRSACAFGAMQRCELLDMTSALKGSKLPSAGVVKAERFCRDTAVHPAVSVQDR